MKYLLIVMSLFTVPVWAESVKTVRLTDTTVSKIFISKRGAVLNFPSKPTKVVLGKQSHFAIEYINNDLVVSPLRSDGRTHLFVYLGARRFNLDLITSTKGATLIQVRDYLDGKEVLIE